MSASIAPAAPPPLRPAVGPAGAPPARHREVARSAALPAEGDASWAPFYRTAAWAASLTVLLIPVAIVSHVVWPPPPWAAGAAGEWFAYFVANPLAGLLNLDLAMLVGLVAAIPLYLALYLALRPAGPTLALVATTAALLGTLLHILSNTALELLSLSQSHAVATTDAQRAVYLAAGEAALSAYYGTVFQVSYVLGYAAYVVLGIAMLRGGGFGRSTAYLGIATGIAGFGFYLPVIGLALSVFVVLLVGAWNILVARHLLRLAAEVER